MWLLADVTHNVKRVKISFKNKSTALIQYREPGQAQFAVSHLNGGVNFGLDC